VRTNRYLSKIKFLKHTAENVTIIKTIEQVTIKDSESVSEISSQPSNATVNILSLPSQKNQTTKLVKKTDKQGTGVIITSDGIIVTHRSTILENEAEYKIFLYDGSYYEGSLLGIDSFNDLAYLKVNAPNLTAISFGESSTVQPGKKLVAIGNVFGEYQNRFAMGLLSNINKTFNLAALSVASTEKYEGVFEMDFNNQEKYLGGPIINYNGELLGIVGKVTIDGKEQYFQIPAGEIKKSIAYVIDGKFENRPFVGAYYVSISKEYALTHSIRRDRGALIYSPSGKQGLAIIAGSPAERAGLQVNDIVIMVNNKAVNLDNPFSNLINQYKKGDMVELTVDRAGSELKLSLSL
ncbi:MAG: serine protease, partial [Candidatus Moranbacteria bacterium]|nr:serine protease [Candidatus Moranbacteria bacterium]